MHVTWILFQTKLWFQYRSVGHKKAETNCISLTSENCIQIKVTIVTFHGLLISGRLILEAEVIPITTDFGDQLKAILAQIPPLKIMDTNKIAGQKNRRDHRSYKYGRIMRKWGNREIHKADLTL